MHIGFIFLAIAIGAVLWEFSMLIKLKNVKIVKPSFILWRILKKLKNKLSYNSIDEVAIVKNTLQIYIKIVKPSFIVLFMAD